jgi:hypothetical protein
MQTILYKRLDMDFQEDKVELFWKIKFNNLRDIWDDFNKINNIESGEWDIVIATMPDEKNAQRYKFLKNIRLSDFERIKTIHFGRKFGSKARNEPELSFNRYCELQEFSPKDRYNSVDIICLYNDHLCAIEFPAGSFSNPLKFDYENDLSFREYNVSLINNNLNTKLALITEHIIFPYDFIAEYPIPTFQPQASLIFLARITPASAYREFANHSISSSSNRLNRFNAHLKKFTSGNSFREWERLINAELPILKVNIFTEKLKEFVDNQTDINFEIALIECIPYLIRGNVYCRSDSSNDISNDDTILVNTRKCIGYDLLVDTSAGWNKIINVRSEQLSHYVAAINNITTLIRDIVDKSAEAEAEKKLVNIFIHQKHTVNNLLHPLPRLLKTVQYSYLSSEDQIIMSSVSNSLEVINISLLIAFDNKDKLTYFVSTYNTVNKLLTWLNNHHTRIESKIKYTLCDVDIILDNVLDAFTLFWNLIDNACKVSPMESVTNVETLCESSGFFIIIANDTEMPRPEKDYLLGLGHKPEKGNGLKIILEMLRNLKWILDDLRVLDGQTRITIKIPNRSTS